LVAELFRSKAWFALLPPLGFERAPQRLQTLLLPGNYNN